MFVARSRIVHARPGLAPIVFEAGDHVPDFTSWPFTVREAALHTGKVQDTSDGATPWVGGNLGLVLKRMHQQMVRRHAVLEMGGEERLAMAERRLAPASSPQQAQAPIVEPESPAPVDEQMAVKTEAKPAVDGFACTTCQAVLPSSRGLKIHQSRAHKTR